MINKYAISFLILATCVIPTDAPQRSLPDSGHLHLVNRENPLSSDFRPDDLVKHRGVELREKARDAFIEMVNAMESDKIYGLKLQSAYRSYGYQQAIFNEKIKELMGKGNDRNTAVGIATRSVQIPGASEHQLGLALDVSVSGKLSQDFADTEAGKWLAENCYKYGFVIRYPQCKIEVTNIIYEPWHLRYVGQPHAKIMKETGLTLEEYHEFLAKIPMYVVWEEDFYYLVIYGDEFEIGGEIVGVSATSQSENAGVIITVKKELSLSV
ncbi:MAG: M15 family metallopeptidase [Defluviitaleaceae bacterium]|nr:M15 family metallopeptidase [Defluviitaleaceae bacterium]